MRKQVSALVLAVVVVGGTAGTRARAADDPVAAMAATCPCDAAADGAAWASHGEYVACVATEARHLRMAGAMRPKERRAAIRAAKHSTCGNDALTRCCVYLSDDANVGQCRMMSPDACSALDDQMDSGEADDEGSGSCVPNPCTF